jgi:hypothetical protein
MDSKNRGTITIAIKSILERRTISRERVSEAHRRNPGGLTCHFAKYFDKWVLTTDSLAEVDDVWLRSIGPALGLAIHDLNGECENHPKQAL